MHWVDRGPEPASLEPIRSRYTPRWVQYYRDGVGTKPTDAHWRNYDRDLSLAFRGLCAFCEEFCKGTVDHFRPKSKFPDLVYVWSNWLFSCNDCNNPKHDKWPSGGYIDPCTESVSDYPEYYFTFDTRTGEILPMTDLSSLPRQRASDMIRDLRLNGVHHLQKRQKWLRSLDILEASRPSAITEIEGVRNFLRSPDIDLPSITRVWLSKQGYSSIS